ncbi:MAG: glycosyltransferase [Bacteroides sp.]|nr:glycosyltransferase [Bacteroides sp.]
MHKENKPEALDLLVNTSWEVCNKIGGIYAVLSTQAASINQIYGDRAIYVGPDVWRLGGVESPYFTEDANALKNWPGRESLPYGVSVRIGRWSVPGRPIAILVDFTPMYAVKDEFYGRMWQLYGVDSLHAYGDYDEACAFSHAAGIVVESLFDFFNSPINKKSEATINAAAHFHEWTTGMGLLYIKDKRPDIATLFTTHATSIGRSICGNGKPLYDYLKGYNGDQMARELNMESKHSLEKAAAHQADCFTTVSDITAAECEQLLERRPDIVTPNGFEKGFVPSKKHFAAARQQARKKLSEVASALTGNQYSDDVFFIATSGRCEYRNKGIDMYLDVMATLRAHTDELDRNVVAFVMVPAWVDKAREDLSNALEAANRTSTLPDPVITHTVNNPFDDPILGRLHALGFDHADPRLAVIYVPCYLDGRDGIFNGMSYYDLLIGMDATVFPSYYEPWGYTPLESIAFGVPTVTTSLSGFGQWVLTSSEATFENSGVNVAARCDNNYSATVDSICRSLRFLIDADAPLSNAISNAAIATSDRAAWSFFISYYEQAYAIAERNRDKRTGREI